MNAGFEAALRGRQPDEPAADWLRRLLDALPPDGELTDDELADVQRTVNGTLANEQPQLEQDPDAYRAFWRAAAERLPSRPYARAIYADTLLLTGDTDGAREEMLAAWERDPRLIYRMSGEYRDVMEAAGGRDWAAYRALAIRAAELHDPKGNEEYVRDEARALAGDLEGDPEVLREVLRLLRAGSP
jgi:hypothetical protein